jgi:hypothetical protein
MPAAYDARLDLRAVEQQVCAASLGWSMGPNVPYSICWSVFRHMKCALFVWVVARHIFPSIVNHPGLLPQ